MVAEYSTLLGPSDSAGTVCESDGGRTGILEGYGAWLLLENLTGT